jgi:hypothetical protein
MGDKAWLAGANENPNAGLYLHTWGLRSLALGHRLVRLLACCSWDNNRQGSEACGPELPSTQSRHNEYCFGGNACEPTRFFANRVRRRETSAESRGCIAAPHLLSRATQDGVS